MRENLLVVDVGGTSVKFGTWCDSELRACEQVNTPKTFEDFCSLVVEKKNELLARCDGAAFSCPGAVDPQTGVIGGSSAVPYLHHFPIKKALINVLEVPVSLQNDGNCAALAEHWRGNAQGTMNACVFVIGTGIGGGIIVNGKLLQGRVHTGGEFGYQIIDQTTMATLSHLGTPVIAGRVYSELKNDCKQYSGEQVFALADAGEQSAMQIVADLYRSLSIGVYNTIVMFNPEVVLIGGAVSKRHDFAQHLQKLVSHMLVVNDIADLKDTTIEVCKFSTKANLLGAVREFMLERKLR